MTNLPASETDSSVAVRFPIAYLLWVVVGAALIYGVIMTVIKASALFTS